MDQSILTFLAPLATAIGVSMDWVSAAAINVMLGTGLIKKAMGISGNWNLLPAGAIALAMGFAYYPYQPLTALAGGALVFTATALALFITGAVSDKIKARGEFDRGPSNG